MESWVRPENEASTRVLIHHILASSMLSKNLNSLYFRLPLKERTYLGMLTFPRASKTSFKVRMWVCPLYRMKLEVQRLKGQLLWSPFDLSTAIDRLVRWKWFNRVMCKCFLHLRWAGYVYLQRTLGQLCFNKHHMLNFWLGTHIAMTTGL